MARVTIEDCLENVENRFALVHITASRVRQILKGSEELVDCDNKTIVTALREIGRGYIDPIKVDTTAEELAAIKIEVSDLS